jgi:hypothetical protein
VLAGSHPILTAELDDAPAVDLVAKPDGSGLPGQEALVRAVDVGWDGVTAAREQR